MNQENQSAEAIAVIGMSGRFPGANNPDEFWQNLITAKDGITRFPARTEADGTKYVGARSMLDHPDLFDASFFNIYPKEAELMDPQHRVFLECAWEALEDGGCDPASYPGMIGVYAGLSLNTYLLNNLGTGSELAKNYQVSEYQTMLGNDKDFLPVRVSYKLNLRGPSMTIQSACSTSLVAICQAATALLTYQCDMALTGGVSISFPQQRDYLYQEDGMVSPDGTCRAFDADAAGTVFGHGCGVVLLKRLSEAVADGDPILAVIKGWAVNNDGSDKIGFAAPGVNAQADVIALAQASAGIAPADVSYIEAHGTGTPLGDPIEVAALTKAFREGGASENAFCALGTGKTHIGHLDCAAGVTGLIKTIQQFRHQKIPALLHYKTPNPHIDFANSPFVPVSEIRDWKPGEKPRIAGVSAFGVGGTNAHVVMEEAPPIALTSQGRRQELLVLSAKSEASLTKMSHRLADHLQSENPALSDVSHTLATGRRAFPYRRAIIASDNNDAITKLREEFRTTCAPAEAPKVAFLFPGQGSQYIEMTREIYDSETTFRQAVDECAVLLRPLIRHDIRSTLYPSDHEREAAERNINLTSLTQPCIFVVEYALAKLWMSWGIQPSLLIGHSIGEYVAAVIAGTFKLENALQLLATRAHLMQELPSGGMLAVRKGAADLIFPPGIELAAVNSPFLCTVSGPHEAITAYQQELTAKNIQCRVLNTSHAFHSAMMEPIVATFTEDASMIPASAPQIPWISTCTGNIVDAETLADPSYWSRQLRHTVHFSAALEKAFENEKLILLEVGPGQALAQFARQHPARATTPVIATLPSSSSDLSDMLAAAGELWKNGVAPDWSAWFKDQQRAKLHLPTYPFERQSFWIDNSTAQSVVPKE
ncbi:MAG: type I polyketide synthase, partial [Gloeobacteraceae cyanobacterium ES-bin-144]|nr:type I polyketide synthase [Verrucomicrobiales bacterium]